MHTVQRQFPFLLLVLLIVSCTHTVLSPEGQNVVIFTDKSNLSACSGGVRLDAKVPRNEAQIKLKNIIAEAGYNAYKVTSKYISKPNSIREKIEYNGYAYKCHATILNCVENDDGKSCHEAALYLRDKNKDINALPESDWIDEQVRYFILGCNAKYEQSCKELDVLVLRLISKCNSKNLDYCHQAMEIGNRYGWSKELLLKCAKTGCKANDSFYCDKVTEVALLKGCQNGNGNECWKLGKIWAKYRMKAQAVAAYERGCELGDKDACVPFSALNNSEQQEIKNNLLYEQNHAILSQTAAIENQTREVTSALIQQSFALRDISYKLERPNIYNR